MCTSDLCPPFGVYYGAQQGTEACMNGACCAGGGFTCICITCDSDSDCPACSNHVVPKCVDGRCKCTPCITNSDCISGYCCEKEKGGAQECRPKGYIYNNIYLCDPPEWSSEENISTQPRTSIFEIILRFFTNLFKI